MTDDLEQPVAPISHDDNRPPTWTQLRLPFARTDRVPRRKGREFE